MKKFLPLFAFVICAATAKSQTGSLLINDNFTTLNAGNLSAANNPSSGWTNPGAANFVQVTNTTPLVYSGYASGTNYITIVNANGSDDPYKQFIGSTTITAATASVYISFVVRVPSLASTVTANASTRTCFYLKNAAGGNLCNFFMGDNGTSLKFGISKGTTANANTGATWATGNYNFNTTYLIVIRYDFVSGTNNDQMYLYVNTDPASATQPATGTAAVSITGAVADPTAPTASAVDGIQIEQTASGATAHFDAFKAAYGTGSTQAANSQFAWSTLSPAGSTLPIKVYYFNAARGDGYNTLNWRAECTSQEVTFVIERSVNGTDFTALNTISASQQRCQQPFDYTDNGTGNAGTLYYRLKVIDDNGKANYSSIVKISGQQKGIQLVGVAPNPVTDLANLSIASVKKDVVDLRIISLDGKMVYRTMVSVQPGTSVVNIDVSSLQKGMYTIKGVFGNGEMATVKFIK